MTNSDALRAEWLEEEEIAHIHGWDFSHIDGRYAEENDLPWDYRQLILYRLRPEMKLLDMDTGGGEFLLSLGHPHENTACTEGFAPNVQLCRETLAPLGIDFRAAESGGALPFADETFDMVINRHGSFDPQEIFRVLKPGGVFITQQVGAKNDRELVTLLLPEIVELPYPDQWRDIIAAQFANAGFDILESAEHFDSIRFCDVGALVWFARVIPWEFDGFSVEKCFDRLIAAQRMLEETGSIDGTIHRFMLIAQKK